MGRAAHRGIALSVPALVVALFCGAYIPPTTDAGSDRDCLANALSLALSARSYRVEIWDWGDLTTIEDWDSGRVHVRDVDGEYEQRIIGTEVYDTIVCHLGHTKFGGYFLSHERHTPTATDGANNALEMILHASDVRRVRGAKEERYALHRRPATVLGQTIEFSDISAIVRGGRVREVAYTSSRRDAPASEQHPVRIRFTRFGTAPAVDPPPAEHVMSMHDCDWYEDTAEPPTT
jgi:hypothetical protein